MSWYDVNLIQINSDKIKYFTVFPLVKNIQIVIACLSNVYPPLIIYVYIWIPIYHGIVT